MSEWLWLMNQTWAKYSWLEGVLQSSLGWLGLGGWLGHFHLTKVILVPCRALVKPTTGRNKPCKLSINSPEHLALERLREGCCCYCAEEIFSTDIEEKYFAPSWYEKYSYFVYCDQSGEEQNKDWRYQPEAIIIFWDTSWIISWHSSVVFYWVSMRG